MSENINETYELLIVENQDILRAGLQQIIQNLDFEFEIIVHAVNSWENTPTQLLQSPNIIFLINFSLFYQVYSSLSKLNETYLKNSPILLLYEDAAHMKVENAFFHGLVGLIRKNVKAEELKTAIISLVKGNAIDEATKPYFPFFSEINNKEFNFTKRESEILKLILKNMSTREISAHLFLSERTVETHRYHLHKKLKNVNIDITQRHLNLLPLI